MTGEKSKAAGQPPKAAKQRGLINHLNLQKRVQSVHQARIKSLQKEVVAISVQNTHEQDISPLLEEINKLRALLKCTGN